MGDSTRDDKLTYGKIDDAEEELSGDPSPKKLDAGGLAISEAPVDGTEDPTLGIDVVKEGPAPTIVIAYVFMRKTQN
jgi:hypothetical protein